MEEVIETQYDAAATYVSRGGIRIERNVTRVSAEHALSQLSARLDAQRGVWLASSYEYPGRYKRFDVGFVDPPLAIEARGREFRIEALNARGEVLLEVCRHALEVCDAVSRLHGSATLLAGAVIQSTAAIREEDRTRVPSVFSVLRAIGEVFGAPEDSVLGLYGAFGYDLVFQLEALRRVQPRGDQRDLVLYLPDELIVFDHQARTARRLAYEFEHRGRSTAGLARQTRAAPFVARPDAPVTRDHAPGEFARGVERAKAAFAAGDLFEVTPSQVFSRPCRAKPSAVFDALRTTNPAPYGFFMNLGDNEFLVGASPEMYVRVQGRRVETCPIAGTIGRGEDALGDARQILALLGSAKDEAELTMCTDVDRNDKARICEPGSVRVIGRRQIELYSRLIHTVDHVEGRLRDGYDQLDAFATHLWAVTLTGAPKLDAMQFIETHEKTPRAFYGGAVGAIGFDGSLNTGLVLRTLHIREGVAQLRAGATLHFDSDPVEEERETELKASAVIAALDLAERPPSHPTQSSARVRTNPPKLRALVIDHRDSFVHTLGDYLRQAGCEVTTLRYGFDPGEYDRLAPQLVVLSPGPGRPDAFGMRGTFAEIERRAIPVFGVCLGLQGMVEFCGGRLSQLRTPVHGKASIASCAVSPLFDGLPRELRVGRYHSLHADDRALPRELDVLATSADGCIMAVAHKSRPWSAVQFHPESILSADGAHGLRLMRNVVTLAANAM